MKKTVLARAAGIAFCLVAAYAAPQTGSGTTGSDSLEVQALRREARTAAYWELGSLIAAVGIMTGLAWLALFRIYDRDRANQEKLVRLQIDGQFKELQQTLTAEIRRASADDVAKLRQAVEGDGGRLEKRLVGLESGLELLRDRELAYLRYYVAELEAFRWQMKKVPNNALREHTSMLKLAAGLANKPLCAKALEAIQTDLRAGANPLTGDSAELAELLIELREAHPLEAKAAQELLDKVRGYAYQL